MRNRLVGGVLLLLVTPQQIGAVAHLLTQHEIAQDPHDLIANGLLHLTNGLSSSTTGLLRRFRTADLIDLYAARSGCW